MDVLLRKDIEKLGKAGDILSVADGYARNYLFPRKLATEVSEENLRRLEADRRRAAREEERRRHALAQLAARLEDTSCTIPAQATEGGTLFGSVAAAHVARALGEEGFEIDDAMIRLEEPIKETGVYAVEIHLAPEITATTRVWVVAD
ncbi:MAG: 50S ribosomal protein L9 [Candidatus Brocadiia bacterium]